MDQNVARIIGNLKSFDDLRQFEANARARNAFSDDVARAVEARSAELGSLIVAQETGLDLDSLTPAESKIVQAAATYAAIKKRKGTSSTRMFFQLRNRGLIGAAEVSVAKSKPTLGFETLASENLGDLSYEKIIVDHPDEFSDRAIWYAKKRLGLPTPTEKPPAAGTTAVQRRTEELLGWLQARSDANEGKMLPFTNAESAAALGMHDMHKFGRVQGNIQSRLDFACYRAKLPPLGLTALAPFEDAWSQQDRSWVFPIAQMQAAAQAHVWSRRDYERIRDVTRGLSGQAHIVWKSELATNGAEVRAWAYGFLAEQVSASGAEGFQEPERTRNPPWSRDELIMALDLYLRSRRSPLAKDSEEVAELSRFLGVMARRLGRTQAQTFRNEAGVYMKMMNFRRLDPQYTGAGKVGLERGNKQEEPVWKEFSANPAALADAVAFIRARFVAGPYQANGPDMAEEMPYWVFVCNPKKWAIDRFLERKIEVDSWGVRPSDAPKFAPGQLGIVRVGVDRRSTAERGGNPPLDPGIYALCEIESTAQPGTGANDGFWTEGEAREPGWPTVKIRYLRAYSKNPLTIDRLRRDLPSASPLLLNGFQGSSFSISQADFRSILDLLEEDLDSLGDAETSNLTAEMLATLQEKYKNASPEVKERLSRYIERGSVGALVKKANGFKCQVCEALGLHPYGFRKASGEHYVEAHHVMPVASKQAGSLAASNVMTVCANHHRQMHYGGIDVSINVGSFDFTIDGKAISISRLITPLGTSPSAQSVMVNAESEHV